MNKLTKKDKYAIEFLHSKGNTNSEIAKELNLDIGQVKRFISKNISKPQTTSTDSETNSTKKVDKTKNLMIRHTSDKKNNSVSIMTQGASQIGDDFYKNMNSATKNTDSYIYRRT
jgi:IS30 family transposase